MSAEQPKQIGKYEIIGVLGKGAMGLVYRGRDPLLGREVALKVITGADITDEMKERFIHEARAVARLDHPNIVVVYDLGEHEGQPYIAMELLVGEDLKDVMRRRSTLPVREAVDIVAQVCDGLAYAHERKIIHRDIKPANIHLCPDGRVKVMDFGVAKMDSTHLTKTGMVIGTPDYMSPEQIQGKAVDSRSDIFATGVVLYELLTRSKPFSADSITSVIYNVVFKEPPSFSDLELDVPVQVEQAIRKAMAKDLSERYATMGEMAADLRAWAAGQAAPERPAAAVAVDGDDATRELSEDEIAEATRAGMPVSRDRSEATQQVGESRTERRRAAGDDATVAGLPAGAATDETGLVAAASGSKKWLIIAAAAALLAVAGFVVMKALAPAEPAVVSEAAVSVDVVLSPWARIDRLERVDEAGSSELALQERMTPVRLSLPPGSYRMEVSNPELGLTDSIPFRVNAGPGQRVSRVLAGFDPGSALGAVLAPGS
jgi:serine/threonine-protein kinase